MKKTIFGPALYPDKLLKAGLAINASLEPRPQRTGFVMHILTCGKETQNLESYCFGNPGDNIAGMNFFAAEKIRRLKERRRQGHSEFSSSESADPDKGMYAGAILAFDNEGNEVYFSVSGLKAEADEHVAYSVADLLGLKTSTEYRSERTVFAREKLAGSVLGS